MNDMTTEKRSKTTIIFSALLLVVLTAGLAQVSTNLWGKKHKAGQPAERQIVYSAEMTVNHFSEVNGIPRPVLKKVLGLQSKADLQKGIASFGLAKKEILRKIEQNMALDNEGSSKNWLKIPLKFALWFTMLITAFVLLQRRKLTPTLRKGLYLTSIALFGIILGSDPSPMGPIKDTIALYGAKGVFFKPRTVALAIFMTTVLLANKFICSWGCQFGVLQDLIFRLNRNPKDTKGVIKQIKLPFALTNSIRIIFFCVFSWAAFAWAMDIIEPIDPFKLYKPATLTLAGIGFISATLIASIVVYRPWCHLLCPFGLLSWLGEQISLVRIKVDKKECTECNACAKACPSTVMRSILDEHSIKPDCFACGTCITVCPTKAISFSASRK